MCPPSSRFQGSQQLRNPRPGQARVDTQMVVPSLCQPVQSRWGKLGVQAGMLGGSWGRLADTQAGAVMPVKLPPVNAIIREANPAAPGTGSAGSAQSPGVPRNQSAGGWLP